MKRALLFTGGLYGFICALGFGCILVQYVAGGAGLQFFVPAVSSGSVLIGLVHVVGFFMAAFLCFAAGVGLCARALVPPPREDP